MRILHVIDTLDVGGAERVTVNLANLFSINGHEVSILILLDGDFPLLPQVRGNVNIFYLKRKNKFNPFYAKQINHIALRNDIIHIHMRHNLRYFWFISIFSSIKLETIFFHDHHGNIYNNRNIDFITKKIISKSIYIGVSSELQNWAIEHCKVKKSYLLENIVIKEKIINQSMHKKEGKNFLLVSNIHPRKNIEFSIEIINKLCEEGKFTLDIIGKIADLEYYNKLIKLIKSYDLEEIISINVGCDNIQQMLNKYDIALHTSKSEAGPLVLIEYLAQSLPFITFSTGEVVQRIREELQILIVDSFDINDWIKKIHKLLLIDRDAITKKMKNIFLNNYSSEKYYNRCLKIYQKNLL